MNNICRLVQILEIDFETSPRPRGRVRLLSGYCPVTVRLLSGYCPVTVRLPVADRLIVSDVFDCASTSAAGAIRSQSTDTFIVTCGFIERRL
ncbi:hypothetical protein F2P81_017561 [Scophthalmus maximus]|uniref:Uncharacterized protein n=1 Tax=Scophthalmus maximus TaxID=52904 RepID=A0A6A4SG27_SCOMX|nr:hypothetical protein F2P81_017561 [Scophthalmus maximus]